MVNENVSLVISRQLLSEICAHLNSLDPQQGKEVCHFILDKIQPRVISFEEQVAIFFLSCKEHVMMWRLFFMPIQHWIVRSLCFVPKGRRNSSVTSNYLWKWTRLETSSKRARGYSARNGSKVRYVLLVIILFDSTRAWAEQMFIAIKIARSWACQSWSQRKVQ